MKSVLFKYLIKIMFDTFFLVMKARERQKNWLQSCWIFNTHEKSFVLFYTCHAMPLYWNWTDLIDNEVISIRSEKSFLGNNETTWSHSICKRKTKQSRWNRNIDGTCAWVYQLAIKVFFVGKKFLWGIGSNNKKRKEKIFMSLP